MKKGKVILAAGLLVLTAIVLWGLVRFYPLWQKAKVLQENMNKGEYAYELDVELDQEKLTEDQQKLLAHLTWLTGFDREALCRLTIRGNVEGDKIHAMICPEGAEEALTDLYFDGDSCVINESAIYNAIRSHLVDQFRLLRLLMPEQQETLYISLEQVEQLFDLNMEALRGFTDSTETKDISVWEYFMMLTLMSEEAGETGSSFELAGEGVVLRFELGDGVEEDRVKMLLEIPEPAETISGNEELFSRIGFRVPETELEMVKCLTVVIIPGEGGEISMPGNLVNQGIIDVIVKVRDWIRENLLDDKGTPVI